MFVCVVSLWLVLDCTWSNNWIVWGGSVFGIIWMEEGCLYMLGVQGVEGNYCLYSVYLPTPPFGNSWKSQEFASSDHWSTWGRNTGDGKTWKYPIKPPNMWYPCLFWSLHLLRLQLPCPESFRFFGSSKFGLWTWPIGSKAFFRKDMNWSS